MRDDILKQVHVVPALPGTKVVYEDTDDGTLLVAEAVLAWRIETTESDGDTISSYVSALTTSGSGDDVANFVGYLMPDGSVERPYLSIHPSLSEAQSAIQSERLEDERLRARLRTLSKGDTSGAAH